MKNKEKDKISEWIRAGKGYKECKELADREGIKTDFHNSFYKWKQEIFPEQSREKAIHSLIERKKAKDEKGIMSVLAPKAWNKTKQKEVDESVIADVVNEALFHFIPCPNKGLKVEDVKEINVGGSIVGLVVYYTDINLNHPLVIFSLRTIMLVLKVRKMCFTVQEKIGEIQNKVESLRKGEFNPPPPEE